MVQNSDISPRPLTGAERGKIQRAQGRIAKAEERARELVRQAVAKRDAEIAAAVRAGASQSDIAKALQISRQAVYDALRRAGER